MEKRKNKVSKAYKVASAYVYWREIMGLCQKRSLVSCCGKCQSRSICEVHRSYLETDNTLSFMNRSA